MLTHQEDIWAEYDICGRNAQHKKIFSHQTSGCFISKLAKFQFQACIVDFEEFRREKIDSGG